MRVAKNTAWQVVGRAGSILLGLVTLRILAAGLGPAGFGGWATILSLAAVLAVLGDLGVQPIIVRDLARHGQGDVGARRILGEALGLRFALGTGAALLAVAVAPWLPYPVEVRRGLAVCALAFPFNGAAAALAALCEARLRMKVAVLVEWARRGTTLLLVWAALRAGAGLVWLAALLIPPAVLATLLFLAWLRRTVGVVRPRWSSRRWGRLLWLALPVGIAAILVQATLRVDLLLVSWMRGETPAGFYGLGHRVKGLGAVLPAAVTVSVFPLASSTGIGEARRLTRRALAFLVPSGVAAAALIAGLAPWICAVLGGPGYGEAVAPLRVLGVATGLAFPGALLGHLLIARGRAREVPLLAGGNLVVHTLGCLLLIPPIGIVGAAWATVAGEATALALGIWRVRRVLRPGDDPSAHGEGGASCASAST